MLSVRNEIRVASIQDKEVSGFSFVYDPGIDNGELIQVTISLRNGREETAKCCSEAIRSILEDIRYTPIKRGYGGILIGTRNVKMSESDLKGLRNWLKPVLSLLEK